MESENSQNEQLKNFVDQGFVIIKNAFSPELLNRIQNSCLMTLKRELKELVGFPFSSLSVFASGKVENEFWDHFSTALKTRTPYEIQKPFWKDLVYSNLISELFLSKPIYDILRSLAGLDLCFQDNTDMTINVSGRASSNYLYKGFHQEVWSGTSTNTLQFWTPIIQSSTNGHIALIPGSHSWGHIPHKNREPIELPTDYTEIELHLNYTDCIVFHSLLLHRSVILPEEDKPRLALPCFVKNFKYPNESFENLRNWRIFSYSPLSLVERKLGNHYLSPFRLLDLKQKNFTDALFQN